MSHWYGIMARRLGALAATAVLGGMVTATLVRTSPGFGTDERQLDPRLSAESRALLRAESRGGLRAESRAGLSAEGAANRDFVRFYARYFGGMLRGDLGNSPSFNRPIAELIGSRLPVTLDLMAVGVAEGWALAFALALPAAVWPGRALARLVGALSNGILCIPVAAIAVVVFCWGGPVRAIVGLVLFPRLFEFLRNLLQEAYARPHVLMARAKGLAPARILLRHVIPICAPEFLALAGISVALAFGASLPVETLCDLPGIGQLAWKAAMARDLPVLVTLTMFLSLLTQLCNAVSDWATAGLKGRTI